MVSRWPASSHPGTRWGSVGCASSVWRWCCAPTWPATRSTTRSTHSTRCAGSAVSWPRELRCRPDRDGPAGLAALGRTRRGLRPCPRQGHRRLGSHRRAGAQHGGAQSRRRAARERTHPARRLRHLWILDRAVARPARRGSRCGRCSPGSRPGRPRPRGTGADRARGGARAPRAHRHTPRGSVDRAQGTVGGPPPHGRAAARASSSSSTAASRSRTTKSCPTTPSPPAATPPPSPPSSRPTTCSWSARRTRSACSAWSAPSRTSPPSRRRRPRVVVNRVRASAVGSRPERRIADALGRFAGMEDVTYLPWDQATLDGAMFAGKSLAEFAPQSELRRAIATLTTPYAVSAPEQRPPHAADPRLSARGGDARLAAPSSGAEQEGEAADRVAHHQHEQRHLAQHGGPAGEQRDRPARGRRRRPGRVR